MLIPTETAFVRHSRHWYRDRAALSFIALEYLPWLGALNLVWEIAHLPLYTVWAEDSLLFIAYVAVHCTLGDVAIGAASLLFALVATRARTIDEWKFRKVGLITVGTGFGYTAFSEWLNTVARESWTYSALMPVITLSGVEIGLSPLLQWLIIPPVALWLARIHFSNRLRERGGATEEVH